MTDHHDHAAAGYYTMQSLGGLFVPLPLQHDQAHQRAAVAVEQQQGHASATTSAAAQYRPSNPSFYRPPPPQQAAAVLLPPRYSLLQTPTASVQHTRLAASAALVQTAEHMQRNLQRHQSRQDQLQLSQEEDEEQHDDDVGSGDADAGGQQQQPASSHAPHDSDDAAPPLPRQQLPAAAASSSAFAAVPPAAAVASSLAALPSRCFLCDYCTSNEVRFVSTFIADNIANMDVAFMAEQIRAYIFDKRPEYVNGNHGLEVVAIRKHIRQHMLSPTVRIADMMRHLLKLCDTLRGNLERVDPDTGESSADRSNIDTYLKVVTKVLDMYKMSETNKMLFSASDK